MKFNIVGRPIMFVLIVFAMDNKLIVCNLIIFVIGIIMSIVGKMWNNKHYAFREVEYASRNIMYISLFVICGCCVCDQIKIEL